MAAEQADADDQYLRKILLGLIDMANDMARDIHTQSQADAQAHAQARAAAAAAEPPAPAPARPAPDLTIRFDRIARAIRRTVLLVRSIRSTPARPTPAQTPDPDPEAARQRAEARKAVLNAVEHALGQAARPETKARRDRLETLERLNHIRNRPDAEIITDILIGLGANPRARRPWKPSFAANSAALARPTAAKRPTPPPGPHPETRHPPPQPPPKRPYLPAR